MFNSIVFLWNYYQFRVTYSCVQFERECVINIILILFASHCYCFT